MQQATVSFTGERVDFNGQIIPRSSWGAMKKALLAFTIVLSFGFLFIIVPYVNISVFIGFFLMSPVIIGLVYFASKRAYSLVKGDITCPKCRRRFEIDEKDVTPPLYGHCPHCKTSYEILLPSTRQAD